MKGRQERRRKIRMWNPREEKEKKKEKRGKKRSHRSHVTRN
jgi:hypothetical protein